MENLHLLLILTTILLNFQCKNSKKTGSLDYKFPEESLEKIETEKQKIKKKPNKKNKKQLSKKQKELHELKSRIEPKIQEIFKDHWESVDSIKFSKDGKYLVSGGSDSTVKLWEIETGKLLNTFRGHKNSIKDVDISDDNELIITSSGDSTFKLWNVKNGNLIKTISYHDEIGSIDISPDKNIFVTGGGDNEVRLWKIDTGKKVRVLHKGKKWVVSAKFSPNGKIIAAAAGKTIKIWEAKTGKQILNLKGHNKMITDLTFTGDSKFLVSCSDDKKVKIWNVKTGKLIRIIKDFEKGIKELSITKKNKILATLSGYNIIKLWQFPTGQLLASFKGKSFTVYSISLSPDGNYLATGSQDDTVKLWSIYNTEGWGYLKLKTNSNSKVYIDGKFAGNAPKPLKLKTGSHQIVVKNESQLKLLNLWISKGKITARKIRLNKNSANISNPKRKSKKRVKTLSSSKKTRKITTNNFDPKLVQNIWQIRKRVNEITFSTDGKYLAGVMGNRLKLWNVNTGKLLWKSVFIDIYFNSLCFSSDSKILATGDTKNKLKLWDVKTGNVIKTLKGHKKGPDLVRISPDGKYLVASYLNNIIVWNMKTGQIIKKLLGLTNYCGSLIISPNSKYFVCGGSTYNFKIRNIKTGKLIKTLKWKKGVPDNNSFGIGGLAISPKGKYLAAGANEGLIKIWNTKTWKLIRTLKGKRYIDSIVFSPNSKLLVSAEGKRIIFWEVNSGKLLKSIKAHEKDVNTVAFTPDGKYFATGSDDTTIKLWSMYEIKDTGHLKIESTPKSTIYIDGVKRGITPSKIELSRGTYQVVLTSKDRLKVIEVLIPRGKTIKKKIKY